MLDRIEVDVRVRGRPGGTTGPPCRCRYGGDLDHLLGNHRLAGAGDLLLRRQRIPFELLGEAIGFGPDDLAPAVDRAGRARRNADHARLANRRIDDVVARVVADRVDRASPRRCCSGCRFPDRSGAGAAPRPRSQWMSCRFRHLPLSLDPARRRRIPGAPFDVSIEAHVCEVHRLVVDAARGRRDPVRELARLGDAPHQRSDEVGRRRSAATDRPARSIPPRSPRCRPDRCAQRRRRTDPPVERLVRDLQRATTRLLDDPVPALHSTCILHVVARFSLSALSAGACTVTSLPSLGSSTG